MALRPDETFVVFHEDDGVVYHSRSFEDAYAAAQEFAHEDGDSGVGVDINGEEIYDDIELAVRANKGAKSLKDIFALSNLPELTEREVMGKDEEKSLEDAYETLKGYFLLQDGKGWAPYSTEDEKPLYRILNASILKQNAKLLKPAGKDEPAAVAYGLSLIPSFFAARGFDSNGDSLLPGPRELAMMPPNYRDGWRQVESYVADLKPRKTFNLCPRATKECMRSCLVKTGQNDVVKATPKVLMTYALQNHPAEFVRLLIGALDKYFRRPPPKIQGFLQFARLNVFSDICWELVAPWLFDRYADLGYQCFFDYTKIPERFESGVLPENYNLTFSYSGTNEAICFDFLKRKVAKVAVVFMIGKSEWKRLFKSKKARDFTFKGFPVVDGDRHDIRPYDEAGEVVALRYKTPKNVRLSDQERASGARHVKDTIKFFVVRATVSREGEFVAEQPRMHVDEVDDVF